MNYKETEKLIEKYISNESGAHLDREGKTVHEYYSMQEPPFCLWGATLKGSGFETIKTNSSYTVEYWSEKYLSNVSYCEGDIYIVQYDNIEDFNVGKQKAIEFYLKN